MKLVNWNVNRAGPWSKDARGVEIVNRIKQHSPEIVCLTETHPKLLEGPNKISAGIGESLRKVLLWSREPWEHVDEIGDDRMPPGRFISGVTRTSVGEVTVVGLCIPWEGSQCGARNSGKRRKPWEDHELYLEHLAGVLARAPSERLVVMGDFNQKIGRFARPRSRRAVLLERAIPPHVRVATSALEYRGIDHIALSTDLAVECDVIRGKRELSDPGRFGIVADVFVRGS